MQYIPFFQSNRVTMQGCGREGKRGVKWGVWVGGWEGEGEGRGMGGGGGSITTIATQANSILEKVHFREGPF